MEQRRQMRREYSRYEIWKRGGRGGGSTAHTSDGREEEEGQIVQQEREIEKVSTAGGNWGGSRLGMEEGKGVQQKQGKKERNVYSRDEE